MKDKPNIVMIMADQMAFNVIGALGHPAVKTPNIDKLVNEGVSFNNCYCNSPLCVPSRASMMTGKLPSGIEVYDNGSELRASVPTFVHHLRRSGYKTILSGKMHFIGPDQLHGFEERLTRDIHTCGFELTPDWRKGVYENPGTGIKRLTHPGECTINTQLLHDERNAAQTIEKIRMLGRENEVDKSPFFLCTSFAQPHDAFEIISEYWEKYKDIEVPMPKAEKTALDKLHPYNRWIQIHHQADQIDLSDKQIRDNRRAYYAMVTYIDDKVGEIIRELERIGLRDNTMVLFTSDHGEMLGEHGMWFKRTFYDPAVKVPLIMSWPGKFPAGNKVDSLVSLVDLGPTLMSLVEVPDREEWVSSMDGESFAHLLYGKEQNWKNEVFFEYYGEGPVRSMIGLREGNMKYIQVHKEEPLLFDLDSDPLEMTNLAGQPGYESMQKKMLKKVEEQADLEQIESLVLRSQRERLMMKKALETGRNTSWEHKPQNHF